MKIQDCVHLGTITKTHGVDGKVILATDTNLDTKDFREPIFIKIDGLLVPFFIITADNKRPGQYITTLELVESIPEASKLIGLDVYLESDDTLLHDDVRMYDLSGITVIDQELGEIGTCTATEEVGGNILLTVDANGKEVLIPFNEDFLVEFMPEESYILLDLPEGLIDLNT